MKTLHDLRQLPAPAPTPQAIAELTLDFALDCAEHGRLISSQTLESQLWERCRAMGQKGVDFFAKVKREPMFKAALWML